MFHPFHLVSLSPWPFIASLNSVCLAVGIVSSITNTPGGPLLVNLGVGSLIFTLILWFSDILSEANFVSDHNSLISQGLMNGFILFVVSEIMVFFSFFWSTFFLALSPGIEIACYWPPVGVVTFNPYTLPLLNTFILLSSGCSITWAHYALLSGSNNETSLGLLITIILGVTFTWGQYVEYAHAPFGLNTATWGSSFFMVTGLHGFHVFLGTVILSVGLVSTLNGQNSIQSHTGLETGILYWHFVDLVWLLVYAVFYIWV